MQRVKAHELRTKDEKALVEELTKFRVRTTSVSNNGPCIERTRSAQS